jgi:hypothetical protein
MSSIFPRSSIFARSYARFALQHLDCPFKDYLIQLLTPQALLRRPGPEWDSTCRTHSDADILEEIFLAVSEPNRHVKDRDSNPLRAHYARKGAVFILR